MNLKKSIRENFNLVVILILALFLYQFTLSNGNYSHDTAQLMDPIERYISTNDIGLVKDTYLYSTHPFYVIFVSFCYRAFNFIPINIFLNEVSLFFAVISIIPIFFFLKHFFKTDIVLFTTILYVFIPFVWFHAVYSSLYSMELFFVNLWFYLIFSLDKTKRNLVISTILLGFMATIHLANLLLLPLFLFLIKDTKVKAFLFCLSILTITVLSLKLLTSVSVSPYFDFVQSELSKFPLSTLIFTFVLGFWEIFNALSAIPVILIIAGFYYAMKKKILF